MKMAIDRSLIDQTQTGCLYLAIVTGVLALIFTTTNAGQAEMLTMWILFGVSLAGIISIQLWKKYSYTDTTSDEQIDTIEAPTYCIVPA